MKMKNEFALWNFTLFLLCFIYTIVNVVEEVNCQRSSKKLDVYIAGFFPYKAGVEKSETGRGVMPSVKIALDHVNEHTTILGNYRLHMWWNDTECKAAVGIKSFFDMMHSGPHKLMLFGAACTHVTDPIAKASKHWHLTQLSYADTHPMFTKDAFPNFFRVVPSENAFNAPRLAFLREFNWTRVGTIYQNEPRFSLPHNHMVADLDNMGCDIVETTSFVHDVVESIQKLREKDVRIILGNFNETYARKVFCEAYKQDIFGRAYVWLIMGSYSQMWWNQTDTDCSVEQLEVALESVIIAELLPLSTSGDITVSGITASEYMKEYNSRRGNEYSIFHGYTYDGIWAVAMAIQYVAQREESFVQNFEYRVKKWENIFLEALQNTSFEGVTGPVRFYNNERKASFLLKQFQHGDWVKIGEYNSLYNHLDLSLGSPVKWVGRYPPKDRTLRIIEHGQVNLTIYAILVACSVIGILIATVFLVVNIRYRNQRYIKMSSPHLNNLIIVGCMLTYLSVIFLGLDSGLSSVEAFPYICTTRAWLLMAGFSLAFGAMFSKTWRVHSIFTDVKLNKKVIKDYQLFMVVGVLLAIDLAIMLTWQIADPFYRDTKQMEPYSHPSLEDVLIVQENEYCQSKRITIFFGIIYAYKGLLLVFGAFLAWETRNVSIPALNDSKHIGLSVYNVTMMCIMGGSIALIISDRKDAVFILISVFIIFCTTTTLFLVFVPKIVELRRNPSGTVDKKTRTTLRPMSKNRRDSSVCELESRMRDVKSNNNKFKKTLMEKERELQELIRKLGPEARKWIDNNMGDTEPLHDPSKLSVPGALRHDETSVAVPEISCVDTTDMTSVASSKEDMERSGQKTPEQKKKRVTLPGDEPIQHDIATNNSKSSCQSVNVTSTTNIPSETYTIKHTKTQQNDTALYAVPHRVEHKPDLKATLVEKYCEPQYQNLPNDMLLKRKNSVDANTMTSWTQNGLPDVDDRASRNLTKFNTEVNTSNNLNDRSSITHSNSELNVCPHVVKGSTKVASNEQSRRVSVQVGSAAVKGNFVVSQSDLWDTHTLQQAKQRSCTSPRKQREYVCQDHSISPVSNTTDNSRAGYTPPASSPHSPSSPGYMQRSVSEKNRTKHRHKPKMPVCQSETDSERERDTTSCTPNRKLVKTQHSHHHSTPNVAPEKHRHRTKKDSSSSMYGACSETELLEGDTAILPIFQKLLTERESRSYRHRNMVGASCPNISIKCDIVEYL